MTWSASGRTKTTTPTRGRADTASSSQPRAEEPGQRHHRANDAPCRRPRSMAGVHHAGLVSLDSAPASHRRRHRLPPPGPTAPPPWPTAPTSPTGPSPAPWKDRNTCTSSDVVAHRCNAASVARTMAEHISAWDKAGRPSPHPRQPELSPEPLQTPNLPCRQRSWTSATPASSSPGSRPSRRRGGGSNCRQVGPFGHNPSRRGP